MVADHIRQRVLPRRRLPTLWWRHRCGGVVMSECDKHCQYAIDVGMPEASCYGGCIYDKALHNLQRRPASVDQSLHDEVARVAEAAIGAGVAVADKADAF